MVVTGCDDEPQIQSEQTDYTASDKGSLPDTLQKQLTKQDSLSKELLHQIDSLTDELSTAKAEIAQHKASIEQMESKGLLWTILPLTISSLAFIVAIIGIRKRKKEEGNSLKNSLNKNNCEIGLEGQIQSLIYNRFQQIRAGLVSSSQFSTLESRIKILEQNMRPTTPQSSPIKKNPPVKPSLPITKQLYANTNSEEFFTDVLETEQDTCVYRIDLTTSETGEFNIISIEKIKQRNGWDNVIDYTGDCTISEAKSFKVDRPGKCEKISADTWKVVEKLKITISK